MGNESTLLVFRFQDGFVYDLSIPYSPMEERLRPKEVRILAIKKQRYGRQAPGFVEKNKKIFDRHVNKVNESDENRGKMLFNIRMLKGTKYSIADTETSNTDDQSTKNTDPTIQDCIKYDDEREMNP